MMGFREDKEARTQHYYKYVHGWKQRKCGACNGSGYYDNNGSPPCSACDGTGKETYKPTMLELHILKIDKKIRRYERSIKALKRVRKELLVEGRE